jgi:hypothetical protein
LITTKSNFQVRVCDLCFEYRYNQQEAEELRGQLTEVDGEQLHQQQIDRSGEAQSPEQQLNNNSGNRRASADRPVAVNLSACSSLPSASSTTAALSLTTTTTTQDQQSMLSVHKLLLTAILLLSHRSPLFASTLM